LVVLIVLQKPDLYRGCFFVGARLHDAVTADYSRPVLRTGRPITGLAHRGQHPAINYSGICRAQAEDRGATGPVWIYSLLYLRDLPFITRPSAQSGWAQSAELGRPCAALRSRPGPDRTAPARICKGRAQWPTGAPILRRLMRSTWETFAAVMKGLRQGLTAIGRTDHKRRPQLHHAGAGQDPARPYRDAIQQSHLRPWHLSIVKPRWDLGRHRHSKPLQYLAHSGPLQRPKLGSAQ